MSKTRFICSGNNFCVLHLLEKEMIIWVELITFSGNLVQYRLIYLGSLRTDLSVLWVFIAAMALSDAKKNKKKPKDKCPDVSAFSAYIGKEYEVWADNDGDKVAFDKIITNVNGKNTFHIHVVR